MEERIANIVECMRETNKTLHEISQTIARLDERVAHLRERSADIDAIKQDVSELKIKSAIASTGLGLLAGWFGAKVKAFIH